MKYYMLQQDTKEAEVPRVVNWFQNINVEIMRPGRYEEIPKVTVLETRTATNTKYKELVCHPVFLLPKEAGKLLKAFEPGMEFRDVILWDRTKHKNHKYVFPLLWEYDCLSAESVWNYNHTVLEKAVLKESEIPDCVLFMPKGVIERTVFAREDFVEALLQNEFLGFKWKELEERNQ